MILSLSYLLLLDHRLLRPNNLNLVVHRHVKQHVNTHCQSTLVPQAMSSLTMIFIHLKNKLKLRTK